MSKISDFEEVAEFHDTHTYELELMTRIKIGNVDSLINFYHTVSYVYQVFKVKLLRDDFWDELCEEILKNWDNASRFHKASVKKIDLETYCCTLNLPENSTYKPGNTFHPVVASIVEDLNKSLEISGSYLEA